MSVLTQLAVVSQESGGTDAGAALPARSSVLTVMRTRRARLCVQRHRNKVRHTMQDLQSFQVRRALVGQSLTFVELVPTENVSG